MGAGQGSTTRYREHNFASIVEARWAVFFTAQNVAWLYDREAEWGLGNEQHYRPQFSLPALEAYFEVQRPDDHRNRRPLKYDHPQNGHVVHLAVGDLPDERQLRTTGWWDPTRGQGVKNLTPGYDWSYWFPPDYVDVLRALEGARAWEFEPAISPMRQPGEGIRDIPKEDREQPKRL